MIKVFECLGVQTFEKDGKKGTNIYYSEPFDDYEKNCSGVKCNHLFTYKNITVPKPGERFKAIYSLGFDFKNQRNIPVLEELDIVPFSKQRELPIGIYIITWLPGFGSAAPLKKGDRMSEDSVYTTETVTESVQDNVNQVNSDYIALGLVGVFLLGCLVGLFVFRVFSSRWHT